MHYFTPEALPGSIKRAYSPEGYLVVRDCPVARTGEQIYGENEIKDGGSKTRVVKVMRRPEDVFRPETLASFEGKDLLLDHPSNGELVKPQTWRDHTRGHMQNVRRAGDFMLADLIVKDPLAIKAIEEGSQDQISAGYDAEYVEDGPGLYHQEKIVGNHGALVKNGRCGEECRVLDHALEARSEPMAVATVTMDRANPGRGRVRRFLDRAKAAMTTGDAAELDRLREEVDELPDELRQEARIERHEIPHERRPGEEKTDDATHMHIHLPGATHDNGEGTERDDGKGQTAGDKRRTGKDQEMESPPAEGHTEPDGDEPATKNDIAVLLNLLKELMDADDENDDIGEEEMNGGEVADRRIAAMDRRRRARDALRMHHKRVHDEVGEIVETKPDKESTGKDDLPGTAGAGKEGISSLSVHDRGRRRTTSDRSTQDSAGLKDTWDLVASRAEILCPGVTLTEGGRTITFDAAVTADITDRRLCALRRRTLDAAYRTGEGREIIDKVTAGTIVNIRTAPCGSIEPLFNAASAMKGERNSRAFAVPTMATHDASKPPTLGLAATAADLNRANRERYKR